jgi:anti-anti-sigma regulatory factor
VLRITQLHHNGSLLLKLEGKLLEPWAHELRALIPDDPEAARSTRLDLRDVSFIDAAGTQLLRELLARGVVVQSTSSFVDQVLHTSREE